MPILPVPPHFDPDRVGALWRVPYEQRAIDAEAWAKTHAIQLAGTDKERICLLLIDCQNTFCTPGFELYVGGLSGRAAVEDSIRICQFIYRNLGAITTIVPTLDTHTAMQIFHPLFWINADGGHPVGGQTVITLADLEANLWRVNPAVAGSLAGGDYAKLQRHAIHYARRLSEEGKYPLMIWPYHAMLGGIGHALAASIEEALFFHCQARRSQTLFQLKGENPLTENYSALAPEVMKGADGNAIAQKNTALIELLLSFDKVIVAGQAKSHCVAWTLDHLITEIQARRPEYAGRLYLLEDCTSPVVVPGVIDFTSQANDAFQRFERAGARLVSSITPMDEWT